MSFYLITNSIPSAELDRARRASSQCQVGRRRPPLQVAGRFVKIAG